MSRLMDMKIREHICKLQNGETPIHLASMHGYVQVIEKLISSGAYVNVVDEANVNYSV